MDRNGIGSSMMLLVRIMKMDESNHLRRRLSVTSHFPGTNHNVNVYSLLHLFSVILHITFSISIIVKIAKRNLKI